MTHRTAPLRLSLLSASLVAALSTPAWAAELRPSLLTQAEFKLLSEDLGSALSFKGLIPAESLGLTGFDIGFALTGTELKNRAIWEKASAGADVPGTLPVPSLRIHKGLPMDIDIGVSFVKVPSSNIRLVGGELRWAVLPGNAVLPAVALRASLTSLSGVDQLTLRTSGLDISVSKGFTVLTPYAGVGFITVLSDPDSGTGLTRERFNQNRVFAGLNMNLGLANFVFEADKTGKASSFGVKMGWRF